MNNVISTKEFRAKLEATLHHNLTLDHPIIGELVKPELNLELMKVMALQGYQLTKNFLEYIENLYFYCPLPKHKKRLLFNLFEEETGRISKTKNHVTLMEDFIRALGISDEERNLAVAYPETQELIDYRMNAVKNSSLYHVGAAAVMIASEGQNLETRAGEARHEILGKLYGLTAKDLLFFSVHQKEDVGHVSEGLSLVSDICDTSELQEQALFSVNHTCQLFWNMYSGVAMRHCPQIMEG
jgi:pyrroloquinoline-quinone synthase